MTIPSVKTEVYEGPLDLLLELIEKRKLLINDISLAAVTDEYIARVNAFSEVPVEELSNFISLASTLLLIKSRSLLPTLELTPEESQDIQQLEYRLALYQLIKQASGSLRVAPGAWYPGEAPATAPRFLPDQTITLATLHVTIEGLIAAFVVPAALPKVEVRTMRSLEEVIESLSHRVSQAMRMSFKEYAHTSAGTQSSLRYEIVVSFLALLELVKQGIIKATQEESGDITLESDSVSTPSYE